MSVSVEPGPGRAGERASCVSGPGGRVVTAVVRAVAATRRADQPGWAMTMMRSSVMSSIDHRSPSRPSPESFTPPYGMWSIR